MQSTSNYVATVIVSASGIAGVGPRVPNSARAPLTNLLKTQTITILLKHM